MSVGKLLIEFPSQACWWVAWAATQSKQTTKQWLEHAVLRQLADTAGVDLSRSPSITGRRRDERGQGQDREPGAHDPG